MRVQRWTGCLWVCLLGMAMVACAGSNASYTRFRQASESGRTMASHEVRVADFVNRFAQEDASPAVLDSADASALYVDARIANPHLPREGATALLGVTLRGLPRTVRMAADLVVVIDVSGSMNEAGKITAVRHALARMLETLDPNDRIALVTFSDDAHLALPLTPVGSARPLIQGAIDQLYASGGTNIHAGLQEGVAVALGTRSDNARVVFLSDGIATSGLTGRSDILHAASALLARHIPVTTIGVGQAIDFELLEAIAEDHGGAFHFVDQPSEVERVFATYVRSLNETSARSVELHVRAPEGARLVRAFDQRVRIDEAGRAASVRLGDFAASDAYVGLFEVEIAAGFAPSSVPIEVRFRTLDGVEQIVARHDAAFGFDASGTYEIVGLDEPGLYRAATMGYAAMGLHAAAQAEERGDVTTAEGWLRSTLIAVEAAQRQLVSADPTRAATLSEPLDLLRRSHAGVLARLPVQYEPTSYEPVASNAVNVITEPTPPVLVIGSGAPTQVIHTQPGVTAVPSSAVIGGPLPSSAPVAGSARFAGWR
ncbi:MAG: VWA domain-containing protein [Deltaproteobacteria bacterium]|nr:VWA domain-containing protein [Deltaproteobacteria bacterium]